MRRVFYSIFGIAGVPGLDAGFFRTPTFGGRSGHQSNILWRAKGSQVLSCVVNNDSTKYCARMPSSKIEHSGCSRGGKEDKQSVLLCKRSIYDVGIGPDKDISTYTRTMNADIDTRKK